MWLFQKNKNEPKSERERVARFRSLPPSHHFRFAVALCAIHYLCIITMLTSAVMLLIYPNQRASTLLIAATITPWFFGLMKP